MTGAGLDAAGAAVVGAALVGRTALAWLPPGEPGRHAPRALLGTWAASTALGAVALASSAAWCALLGVPWSAWTLGALALGAWGARAATLPARMVANPDLGAPKGGRLAALLLALAALVPLAGGAVATGPAFEATPAGWRAAALARTGDAAVFAAEDAREAPTERRPAQRDRPPAQAALLALPLVLGLEPGPATAPTIAAAAFAALLVLLHRSGRSALRGAARAWSTLALASAPIWIGGGANDPGAVLAALAFGGGLAFAADWWRRADGRALVLAALCFAQGALVDRAGTGLALGGLAALVVATHANARARAWRAAAGALAAVSLPWFAAGWVRGLPAGPEPLTAAAPGWGALLDLGVLGPLAAASAVVLARSLPARRLPRDVVGLLAALVLGPGLAWGLGLVESVTELFRVVSPGAALLAAAVLGRRMEVRA